MRWMLLLALCGLGACRNNERREVVPPVDTLSASFVAQRAALALAPARAASDAEARFAEQAATRITREPVRQYAQVIAADHRAVVSVLDSVARARAVSLEASAATRDVENGVRTAHAAAQSAAAEEFDLAFMRAEVNTHRQLVDRLDRELIPAARGDARQLLVDIRAMSDAHLTRARQILTELLGVVPAPARPAEAAPRPVRPDTTMRPRTDTLSVG